MKALVVYDSKFGNTEKVAKAIAGAIGKSAKALHVGKASPAGIEGIDVLIVGSPTQAWSQTKAIQQFIKSLSLSNVSVAGFDTRFKKMSLLTGSAAKGISKNLQKAGGTLAAEPESFFVAGTEGPLLDGEIERAKAWAKDIVKTQRI